MIIRTLLIALLTFCMYGCNGQNTNIASAFTDAKPVKINRFDKALYPLIVQPDTLGFAELNAQYPSMTDITGKAVLNMQSVQIPGFYTKLTGYYSEPTLNKLYRDAITKYEDVTLIEQELGNAFAWLEVSFPDRQIPEVYFHISGLNQNVLVGDNLISLSIDKYLGEDYPLYMDFFYDAQRRLMTPAQIVPDFLSGWLMGEFPFEGKENVLLDRMIYEGKIKYLISKALPELSPETLMGYTKEEYKWCLKNEEAIWKAIIERKQLYTPDLQATSKYFETLPNPAFNDKAPGNIGTFMGWQIIQKYMDETHASAEQLMQNEDSQQILTEAKYKP